MNTLLWVFQILLALHTFMGAVWKLSNPEQNVVSLKAMPHEGWILLCVIEFLCVFGLVFPTFKKSFAKMVPIACAIIIAEMVLFCILHIISGDPAYSHLIYWSIVAAISAFIAFGRIVLKPL